MAKKPSFSEVLRAAINDVVDHGFDKAERMEKWLEKLRKAALDSLPSEKQMDQWLRDGLIARYRKLVDGGEIARINPGVSKFTIKQLTPKMRDELTKRIMASAQLIKLNRKKSIDATLQRFAGWMSSVPAGGTEQTKKRETKAEVGKALSSLPFEERRCLIDQSAKLVSSINKVVAEGGGAIAGEWHSNYRQSGYDARIEHEHRDGEVFAIRGNWAIEKGLMKAGPNGYTDDIEKPAELPFCRCVPGSTRIPFANIETVYRRWYRGPMLEFMTTTHKALRLTPNHPVLSAHGWRSADTFNVGDYLVETIDEIVEPSAEENENNAIPTIAEIFEFLSPLSRLSTTKGTSDQFHGDGLPNSHVDIVYPSRTLSINYQPCAAESGDKLSLANANFGGSAFGALLKHRTWFWFAALRATSCTGSFLSRLLSFISHSYLLGFRCSTKLDASAFEPLTYSGAGNSMEIGNRLSAHSRFVSGNDVIHREIEPVTEQEFGFRFVSDIHTSGAQPSADRGIRDIEFLCKIHGINPSKVRFSQITGIKRDWVSTHVYNLQTTEGWYVADGIISHNCYYTYKYNLGSLPPEMLTAKGKAALADARAKLAE